MTDLSQEVPATELTTDADLPATGGGRDEIAGQLKDALSGGESTEKSSPHEDMRRQIGEELAKATAPETAKPAETTTKPAGERARGADGRFIPTAQEAAAGIDPNATPEGVQAEAVPAGPPTSWKKELQARWGELPPEFQAEIQKREADVAKGFEKYQNLRVHEPVLDFAQNVATQLGTTGPQLVHQWAQIQEGLIDPNRRGQVLSAVAQQYGVPMPSAPVMNFASEVGQKLGMTPTKLMDGWALFQEAMLDPARKRQAVENLVKNYGVDMGQPAGHVDQGTWIDPDVAALKQQIADMQGWRSTQEQQAQQYYQQQMHQVQTAKVSAIDTFASEKGADGQPLRPHLATVMPDMVAGIQRAKSANPQISDQEALQQAYDNAVWGNPSTREAVMQQSRIAEDRERTEKARLRAQNASRGAVSPAGSSPQGPPATTIPKGDIRDQMRATLQQLT